LHAEIAKENDEFALKDVEEGLFKKCTKGILMYLKSRCKTGKEVLTNWEKTKEERNFKHFKILASFISTLDIQDEAKYIGLEFRNKEEILTKFLKN